MNAVLETITQRIRERSRDTRAAYVALMAGQRNARPSRSRLSCTNLAHGFAASPADEKVILRSRDSQANLAMVSAYNDLLSAHQPYRFIHDQLRAAVVATGNTLQFAGGVPAMCDGITQGMPGMELSLFSRDIIAQATAIALCHEMFDGVLLLGICDKIVPGLLIGALRFGHLPALFIPAGPMPSGISNKEKALARQQFVAGEISEETLLEVEAQSYHSPGTCTFYGTANSNQILMEVMGLQLPGGSFENPGSALRQQLTAVAATRLAKLSEPGTKVRPLYEVIDERSLVNAVVALLATGGSTNHTIHLIAIARAAGIQLTWDDFNDLSVVVPLLVRVYPNGEADINAFRDAGDVPFLVRELLSAGLLHGDARTMWGETLADGVVRPVLVDHQLVWTVPSQGSGDERVLRTIDQPFAPEGGLRLVQGNLGRAVVKTSAIPATHWTIRAPARVFDSQAAVLLAFQHGELTGDFVLVLSHQGPRSNGMPELHGLMPILGALQDRGQRVALVTDGRLSGASGKVLSAIHVSPEAQSGGMIGRVHSGDVIEIDADAGVLHCHAEALASRAARLSHTGPARGLGRELFAANRQQVTGAEQGAMSFGNDF